VFGSAALSEARQPRRHGPRLVVTGRGSGLPMLMNIARRPVPV
jgi:hypothetical protein